jgi:hypothetical protein
MNGNKNLTLRHWSGKSPLQTGQHLSHRAFSHAFHHLARLIELF